MRRIAINIEFGWSDQIIAVQQDKHLFLCYERKKIYIYQVVSPKMINTVIIHYIIPFVGHATFHYT